MMRVQMLERVKDKAIHQFDQLTIVPKTTAQTKTQKELISGVPITQK
jgi:hypothetical protein